MNTNTQTSISYTSIQQALERCMAAEPVNGKECGLSRDASLLGDILGEMIWRKLDEIPMSVVEGKHLEAVGRWVAEGKAECRITRFITVKEES